MVARRRRSRRANVKAPLTSMGDIAFLLIAFFVLASQFTKDVGRKYEPPKSRDIDQIERPPTINIVVEEEPFYVYLDGEPLPSIDSLEAALAQRTVGLEGEGRRVVFKADIETPNEIYQQILEAIAANSLPVAMAGDEDRGPKKQPQPADGNE